jgi:hypothetical protein
VIRDRKSFEPGRDGSVDQFLGTRRAI